MSRSTLDTGELETKTVRDVLMFADIHPYLEPAESFRVTRLLAKEEYAHNRSVAQPHTRM